MAESGLLIAFEGISACGKSTQIELVEKHLVELGYQVCKTSWNSDEVISPIIGQAKRERLFTPITWSILHATEFCRRYREVITPALEANQIVLADRYYPTAYARDTSRGISKSYVEELYSFARRPDLILYFDLPPGQSAERRLKRHPNLYYYSSGCDINPSLDIMSSFLEYQRLIYERYAEMKGSVGLRSIDASQTPDQVFADVLREVEPLIKRS